MKNMPKDQLLQLIKTRRSVYPHMYTEELISREIVMEILEAARWAPTHKHTEPWRFKVFAGEARQRLGIFLAEKYKEITPSEKYLERKYKKALKNPVRASHVIAICMQRDPEEAIPEWEEIAAVAMAVQNMWLTCHAYGIGCYWSSPKTFVNEREFLHLREGERCLGILYMGYPKDGLELTGEREEMSGKVEIISN